MVPLLIILIFVFALGASVGSFLNVVVYRMPNGLSLVTPPSHCPKCSKRLKWYDNVPVLGWLKLGGRCRFCKESISIRYLIVEALTGGMFVLAYLALFVWQRGPGTPFELSLDHFFVAPPMAMDIARDWPLYGFYVFVLSALLAASLIDADCFYIPLGIPYVVLPVAVAYHTILDGKRMPGSIGLEWRTSAALSAGACAGLLISLLGWWRGWIAQSFPKGEPIWEEDRAEFEKEIREARARGEEVDDLPPPYTAGQIRREMRKEMLFLTPPLLLGIVVAALQLKLPGVDRWFEQALRLDWVSGLLGSMLGAMAGALIVWLTRILGTLAFGRVAMGLGDVHLMFAAGAVVGAVPVIVAFFAAPVFGLLYAVWALILRRRREVPFGPFLSMGTAFVMFFYRTAIHGYLSQGLKGLALSLQEWF